MDADRMRFRETMVLLEDGRPFGERMEPWQRADFAALDSGDYRHAFLERPRGHSKTGDLGTEAVTELILGQPGQALYCAAADEGQARLLFEDVADKLQRNPALRPLVKRAQKEIIVKATGSRLKVLNSDAPSAYGLRPDWIAIDELAEWKKRDLWDSLWSASGKRPQCRVVVISTAGWDQTGIAWEVRSNAEQEPDWLLSSRGQCASWIRPEWLAQQQRTLPPHVFARLHECRWVDGVGAWLSSEQVDAIFRDPPDGSGPRSLGVDLGIARDRAVIAEVEQVGLMVVVRMFETYTPTRHRRVDLTAVEADLATLAARETCPVVYDPYQAIAMAQRLTAQGVQMVEYPFTGDKRRALFAGLLDLVTTGRLRAQPHAPLRQELLGLEVKEAAAGWRVDHRVGQHDDHVVALGLAVAGLPACRAADLPVLSGGFRATAQKQMEEKAGVPMLTSTEAQSIARHEAAETGPGGGRRTGLIL